MFDVHTKSPLTIHLTSHPPVQKSLHYTAEWFTAISEKENGGDKLTVSESLMKKKNTLALPCLHLHHYDMLLLN